MNYAEDIENMAAFDSQGNRLAVRELNQNTWSVTGLTEGPLQVSYDIKTHRQFVANSYVDSSRAYIVPANTFLYPDGYLNLPVTVEIKRDQEWDRIATGLEKVPGSADIFAASDYDLLYDCPILIGNLEELPSFYVNGIRHRFIGYQLGHFDKAQFMASLKQIVETSVDLIGDIPYNEYTFIGLGPGRGGIEHLNNTTISFNGDRLISDESMVQMLAFIAHEYFHHFNVKRIRPFELGPFDYDKENRTSQLWISEGLSVYYEYLILRRAGLIDESTLLNFIEGSLNAFENDQGRYHQSLQQASYYTWEDGPFGDLNQESDRSISIYEKGPIVGMVLDFEIRNATQNRASLDDVMRMLYWHYYKEKQRGFTDAEFQQVCESVAGVPLTPIFEYIATTKEIDYQKYLNYAGLMLTSQQDSPGQKNTRSLKIERMANLNPMQQAILHSWQKNQKISMTRVPGI
jgi:predicted metalloprotease with PDZ domain